MGGKSAGAEGIGPTLTEPLPGACRAGVCVHHVIQRPANLLHRNIFYLID
jgi:hypothetical protein